jgi:hypothetical protein
LPIATTPLADEDELVVVQSGETKRVAKSEFGGGGATETLKQRLFYFHDFTQVGASVNSVWSIGSQAGNAQVVADNLPNTQTEKHLGILRFAVNTFALSNGTCSDGTPYKLAKGLFNYAEFACYSFTHSDMKARFGFRNTNATALPNDGCFIDIDNTGLVTFFSINNNVQTSIPVATILRGTTIPNAIYYKYLIYFEQVNLVRLIIRNDNDELVANVTINTNLPSTNFFGQGMNCFAVTAPPSLTNVALLDKIIVGAELPNFLTFML